MWQKWIDRVLLELPGTDDALFQNVWGQNHFIFDGIQGIGNKVDHISACLVAATLKRREKLLLILPDLQPHRPAFLMATALIRHFLDSNHPISFIRSQSNTVLYFGSNIGIREQLRRTSIHGLRLDLASVFSQDNVLRGSTSLSKLPSSQQSINPRLPRVITVYSPAEPIKLMQTYHPCWIAIDCSDSASLSWLQPLLKEAHRAKIPVIAWGQNPLSECIDTFTSMGHIFTWPSTILNGEPNSLLHPQNPISLEPLVLQSESINSFCTLLQKANILLCHASQHANNKGRIEIDSVIVHWKYLRALELLCVPIEFYDAEANRYWGLQSFSEINKVCDRYRSACMQSDTYLYKYLIDVAALLNNAKKELEDHGCALWEALTNICIEDPIDNELRTIVFTSNSRKQLFLFAMLARHNTTEYDLHKLKILILNLRELRQLYHSDEYSSGNIQDDYLMKLLENNACRPILVGLPSPTLVPKLLYVFFSPKSKILLFPHQYPSFMRRQSEWSIRLGGNTSHNADVLAYMSEVEKPPDVPISHGGITVEERVEINISTTRKTRTSFTGSVWQPEDPVTEVSRLFEPSEGDEELVLNDNENTDVHPASEFPKDLWCEEAIRVQFDQDWQALFSFEDKINIVSSNGLDYRYVSSLKVGDQVLVIHGQQRQSLYDLIISRVHKHPSIELHLAMIQRWQEDFRIAYEIWSTSTVDLLELQQHGRRNVDSLLRRMQSLGSQLVAPLTLVYWLRGDILCPIEPEDLRRLAEVLDMKFVHQYYKHISKAASRLRGLHRGLSHKLNRWLQDQATGVVSKDDEDVIDRELGLTFGDIRSSLLLLSVQRIDKIGGPFLRSNLGQVIREI